MADDHSDDVLTTLHQSTLLSLDRVFQVVYAAYSDKVEDKEDLYRLFVGVLAQTLGRHIAAFPEAERDELSEDAIVIFQDTLERTLEETQSREAPTIVKGVTYDLATLEPKGRA